MTIPITLGNVEGSEPGRLWSLWDMLSLKGEDFVKSVARIARLRTNIERALADDPDKWHEVPASARAVLKKDFEEYRQSIAVLQARVTTLAVDRVLHRIEDEKESITSKEVMETCKDIESRLKDEMTLVRLFALEGDKQRLYEPEQPLFGAEFVSKFPSAIFELDEASKCLALGRSTASAFHLMRIMEIGLYAVMACMGVPSPAKPSERNWGRILERVKAKSDEKTKAGDWALTTDREFFADTYASLDAVRIAWRNTTMHVENKYSEEEAENIFYAVRGFMKNLASRMDERGAPLS